MTDGESQFKLRIDKDTGRVTCRFDVKAHVYSEEENQLILDTVIRLKEENAKLRKLVQEAIYARDDADWASIVSTAIELGIEVDG